MIWKSQKETNWLILRIINGRCKPSSSIFSSPKLDFVMISFGIAVTSCTIITLLFSEDTNWGSLLTHKYSSAFIFVLFHGFHFVGSFLFHFSMASHCLERQSPNQYVWTNCLLSFRIWNDPSRVKRTLNATQYFLQTFWISPDCFLHCESSSMNWATLLAVHFHKLADLTHIHFSYNHFRS